ncbi:hypothetical protein [Sphingomonas sp. PAMC 26605]|uniref:hypothetical protein n=1 Tax=Sphingomonas sp. PAMC 26605 TaxID=1112214 RepID=UPI00026CD68F|nr:hypothetical protein [Sphingomonas sp. PAMC 26605]
MTDVTYYYLEDYSDEIIPCDPTLDSWAKWLSKPDHEWHRPQSAADGASFKASVLRMSATDLVATRTDDGWAFDRDITPDFIAVRWGRGMGWDADSIVGDMDELRTWLDENSDGDNRVENIAFGWNEPDVLVIFHADGPRCTVESVQ